MNAFGLSIGQPWDTLLIIGAAVTALVAIIRLPGIIWRHILQPLARSVVEVGTISELSRVAPDLIRLSKMASVLDEVARNSAVLNEIARQFKTDSGSSLRDVINRLEVVTDSTAATVAALQRTASAPAVIQTARVEASGVQATAADAAAEVMAVAAAEASEVMARAARAAAQLLATAEKKRGDGE